VTRFRYHSALLVAGIIATIGALSLASQGGLLILVLIPPLLFCLWAWRAGTDADAEGLRVQALFGSQKISWSRVAALTSDDKGRGVAALTDGGLLPLPAVRSSDLTRLAAASGKLVSADEIQ
jgi:hypothetical protein